MRRLGALLALLGATWGLAIDVAGFDLVRDGKPAATIVTLPPKAEPKPKKRRRPNFVANDAMAARVLVDWIEKITDVRLPIAAQAPAGNTIYIGAAAIAAGLDLDGVASPSQEGLRVVTRGSRLLLAGQNGDATVKAACRLLEELGCRYFMSHSLGEVFPRRRTLTVGRLDLTEKPGMMMRRIWGSNWHGNATSLWKLWNGAGGVNFGTGHSWRGYVPPALFKEHPEWFAERGGRRYNNQWLCTSNPAMRQFFAQSVVDRIRDGTRHPSLSPPDGRGYCGCADCQAQDDPDSLEPAGAVSKTNRFVDFYRDVGRRVAKDFPDSVLSFYAYADYTQPPSAGGKLPDNLCAWVAPIRYCWLHGMGDQQCSSRQQLKEVYKDWGKYVSRFGYRGYNYNFGDCALPYSKISLWQHDIPYLRDRGCVGISMETLACWMVYGPHIYLFSRLSYDPDADADAIMQDYFRQFYGPKAGPHVKEYFYAVDKLVGEFKCDETGARGLETVGALYTPEVLARLRRMIDQATAAAGGMPAYAERVAMTEHGLRNAEEYAVIRDAMAAADFVRANQVYGKLMARNGELVKAGLTNHYTLNYLERFLGRGKELLYRAAISPPNNVLHEFPDKWRHRWDHEGIGHKQGYYKPELDDAEWNMTATYGAKMTNSADLASHPDWKGSWFRAAFRAPAKPGKLAIFFSKLHAGCAIYVNGKLVSGAGQRAGRKWGASFLLDVAAAVQPGDNLLAIHRPHAHDRLVQKPITLIEQHQ